MLPCFKKNKIYISKEKFINKKKHLNIEIIDSNTKDCTNIINSIVNKSYSSKNKELDLKVDNQVNIKKNIPNKIMGKNLKLFDENHRFLLKSMNNYDRYSYESLPFEGWIKPCYNKKCRLQTSKFIIINNYSKYYFCHECLRSLEFLNFFQDEHVNQMETNWKPLFKYLKIKSI